jgi:hypothetical protein
MSRKLGAIGAVLLNCWGSTSPLVACGDKFVGAASGARFQQGPVGRQELILVFNNPASDVPLALAKARPDAALRSAGYQPTLVAARAEFDEKLRHGRWDLVIVGLDDVAAATHGAGRILPVALKASKARLIEMRKSYPVMVTRESNSDSFVRTVAEALATRGSRTN